MQASSSRDHRWATSAYMARSAAPMPSSWSAPKPSDGSAGLRDVGAQHLDEEDLSEVVQHRGPPDVVVPDLGAEELSDVRDLVDAGVGCGE